MRLHASACAERWIYRAEDCTRYVVVDGTLPLGWLVAGPRPLRSRHWPLITILSQQTDHQQRRGTFYVAPLRAHGVDQWQKCTPGYLQSVVNNTGGAAQPLRGIVSPYSVLG